MRTIKGIEEAKRIYDAAMAGDPVSMLIFSELVAAGELTDEKQAEIIKRVSIDEQKRSDFDRTFY